MTLSRFFRLVWSAVFGPKLPQIQVNYCDEFDHLVVLIGNGMPPIEMMATMSDLPNGITAILELYSSDQDLAVICERIVTGIPVGPGNCLFVSAVGAEGERIAQIMRRDTPYGIRLYLAILHEVQKFRARPGFADRAQYWRTMREIEQAAFASLLSFAQHGFDDGDAGLFVIMTGDGEIVAVSIGSLDDDYR